jgi:integrase
MTAAETNDVWIETSGLSNRERSRIHAERAKVVLADAWSRSAMPVVNGRVCRHWLADRIGCGSSAPSQNYRLKRVLSYWDSQVVIDSARCIQATRMAIDEEVPVQNGAELAEDALAIVANVVPFRSEHGKIETVRCDCASGSYEFPNLLWRDGIDKEASDWLRGLIVEDGHPLSTVDEYAKILRGFVRFRKSQGFDWDEVDDELLRRWRDANKRKGICAERFNTCLGVVFRFYRWLEQTGRLRYHVQIYDLSETPAAMANHRFPITAMKVINVRGRLGAVVTWESTQRMKSTGAGKTPRHTPSEDETRRIHTVVAQKRHGVRDSLLFSWAEETGGRRKEILSINIAQLPSPEELERLIEEDRPWHIRIVRKGGKKWELIVLPDLLMRTLDYIRSEREQIVETHGVNPDEVFLSERGNVLRPDSLTKLGKKAFEKAGVRNSNVHRFRAKFLLATIEALIDAMDVDPERVLPGSNMAETILVKAVEVMGHSSVESLRPYLNYALNRRVQNSKAFKLRNLDAKIRQLFHREAEARERLRKLVALDTLLRDLGETGHEEVAKRLSAILA